MDYEEPSDLDSTTGRGRRTTSSPQQRRQPPLSYSNPLPQNPWERPSSHLSRLETQRNDAPRQQRPPSFRSFVGRGQHNDDSTPLYSQSRIQQHQSLQAPDSLEHSRRAVSQPNTPAPYQQQHEPSWSREQPLLSSPVNRRRIQSVGNAVDAPFTDEEELVVPDFRLFVEATAGLSSEQLYSQPPSPSGSAGYEDRSGYEHIISPIQETPTTMFASRQLAQLPSGSNSSEGRRVEVNSQGGSAGMAGMSMWLLEDAYGEDNADQNDDELPDYAQSQAEAQAAQRYEAARRAQELQRRWQQSR